MTEITARLSTALADRYKIERHLGEGGMANVYLAHDLKHDRPVAVKVLRPELAAVLGAERFVQEIKTTANLQHPHILPLFDSGEADSFLYYVMPFIDGETLRDKLNRETQLGIDEAVGITTAIADALDYAHRQNVIHRDIKPENILLHDGRPMVADFGIALAVSAAAGGRMTETGLSLGTPHYMSPEQATAEKDLTNRSDIYSLGVVLYEMLAGAPPHLGGSAQQIIMKIVTDTPRPLTELRKSVPPHVAAATAKSLEKLAADRFESAAKFAEALTNPAFTLPTTQLTPSAAEAAAGGWSRLSIGLAAVGAVFAVLFLWSVSQPAPSAPVIRYSMALAEEEALGPEFGTSLALSPDGSRLVYSGPLPDGNRQLWLRERNELRATPIPGTEGGYQPFFSPDGQRVGFLVTETREVKVVSLTGEPPVTLVDTLVFRLGATWGPDDFAYYSAQPDGGLAKVPVAGGTPEVITVPDSSAGVRRHAWPHALPNGRGLIVTLEKGVNVLDEEDDVGVVDLETGEARALVRGVWGKYSATGHLIFLRVDGALLAAPFDQNSLQLTGPAVPLLGDVTVRRGPDIALSDGGRLVYTTGEPAGPLTVELVWIDRPGRETVVEPGWTVTPGIVVFNGPRLSPDGRQIAMSLVGPDGTHIWIKQLGGPLRRITFQGINVRPWWTPDGASVLFSSDRVGPVGVFRRTVDGLGSADLVLEWEQPILEAQLSPGEEWIVFRDNPARNVYALRPAVDSAPQPLLTGDYEETSVDLSPDGRWIAYRSNETGRSEIYVAPFPDVADGKWQISRTGGWEPVWSRNGEELFFVTEQNALAVVSVSTNPTFAHSEPNILFRLPVGIPLQLQSRYDVTSDGQQFLTYRPIGPVNAVTEELIVVENFLEELKAKVGR